MHHAIYSGIRGMTQSPAAPHTGTKPSAVQALFYTGIFEVVIHDMPKEQAVEHIQRIAAFLYRRLENHLFEMEVKTSERVDRPERMDSLPYLRQQDPHQGKSRYRLEAFSAVLS